MELQHTHTFRVTMTRSHRSDTPGIHTSIKTKNTFDTNVAVKKESTSAQQELKSPVTKLMELNV